MNELNEQSDVVDIARSYWKAECERDLDLVLAHYHRDAVFHHPGGRLVGHEQIIEYYSDSARRFPILTVELAAVLQDGSRAAIEWTAVMTDAAGTQRPLRGTNIVEARAGKFQTVHAYFDPSTLDPN